MQTLILRFVKDESGPSAIRRADFGCVHRCKDPRRHESAGRLHCRCYGSRRLGIVRVGPTKKKQASNCALRLLQAVGRFYSPVAPRLTRAAGSGARSLCAGQMAN
jgi:hypothetical protein